MERVSTMKSAMLVRHDVQGLESDELRHGTPGSSHTRPMCVGKFCIFVHNLASQQELATLAFFTAVEYFCILHLLGQASVVVYRIQILLDSLLVTRLVLKVVIRAQHLI